MKEPALIVWLALSAMCIRAQTNTAQPCKVKVLGHTEKEIRLNRNDVDKLFVLKPTWPDCKITSYSISFGGPSQCINDYATQGDTIAARHRRIMQFPGTTTVYFANVRFSCAECATQSFIIRLYP